MTIERVKSLVENVTCLICMDVVTRPCILSCCSRIVCRECFNTWRSEQDTCPHCRGSLQSECASLDLGVDFRSTVAFLRRVTSVDGRCPVHNKPAEFLCEDCQKYLCADCLFEEIGNPVHTGHNIHRMQDLLNRLKQDLLVAVEALLAANRRISALAREMRVRACAMEADALEQQELLCSLQDSITGSVARAFVDHRKALQERVDRLARDRYAMPRVLQSVEELVCEAPNLGELQYMCSVLANIRLELDEAMQPIPRPTPQDELVPPFVETKFVIHDFERAFGEGTFVYTEQAAVYGNTWRLKVYPRGHMDAEGRFVSVFVEPVKGPVQPGWYDYRIELRSANLMEDPVIRLNRSEFVANRVLGWNKAIPIERLRRAQFLTRGGDFVIYLNLRPISYHQAYLDAMAALTEERERRALLAQASTMS